MNPLQAGLSIPDRQERLPVGAGMLLPQSSATLRLSDGSEMLMTGIAVPFTGRYAKAAKLRHLQLFGTKKTMPGGARNFSVLGGGNAASNGRTIVITTGISAGEVLTSVDGGATFTAYTIASFSGPTWAVVWAGDRFVVVGKASGGSAIFAAHSSDGINWTLGSASGGASDNRIALAYNPSNGVVALYNCGVSGATAQKCTAGSTFTSVAASPNVSPNLAGFACDGTWFIGVCDTGQFVRFNADMTVKSGEFTETFSAAISNNANNGIAALPNGTWVVSTNTAGVYFWTNTPADDASWKQLTFPAVTTAHAPIANQRVYSAGGYIYMSLNSSCYRTQDGLQWDRISLAANSPGTQYLVHPVDAGFVAISHGVSTTEYLHAASLVNPDYVGTNYMTYSDNAVLYHRVR